MTAKRKQAKDRKFTIVGFKVTVSELKVIDEAATAEHLSRSSWLRKLALDAAHGAKF